MSWSLLQRLKDDLMFAPLAWSVCMCELEDDIEGHSVCLSFHKANSSHLQHLLNGSNSRMCFFFFSNITYIFLYRSYSNGHVSMCVLLCTVRPPLHLPIDHMITDLMSGPDEELGVSEWITARTIQWVLKNNYNKHSHGKNVTPTRTFRSDPHLSVTGRLQQGVKTPPLHHVSLSLQSYSFSHWILITLLWGK